MLSEDAVSSWKRHTNAGNYSFENEHTLTALAHYRRAISQAECLFDEGANNREAVAILVVSYHNIADLYLRESEPLLAENELNNVHQRLTNEIAKAQADPTKMDALLWGLNRTYFALTKHRSKYSDSVQTTLSDMPNLFKTTFKNTLN